MAPWRSGSSMPEPEDETGPVYLGEQVRGEAPGDLRLREAAVKN